MVRDMDDLEKRRKKLLYRASYRGFKEADLLIGGFARAHLPSMCEGELSEFEMLLEINDRELYAWAMGDKEPPADWNGIVLQKLRTFRLRH